MKKKFVASNSKDGFPRITSVFAETEVEAKEEIRRVLNRPGRFSILDQWIEKGEMVFEVED